MRNRKRMTVVGGILLIAALVIVVPTVAAPEAIFNWSATTSDYIGQFTNNGTGGGVVGVTSGTSGLGVYGWCSGGSSGCVRGYSASTGGLGVVGRAPYATGVYGEGGTGSGDYGGYFQGYEGVRGIAVGSNGYGTWGQSSGTYGIGAYGYASGTSAYGGYFYSSNYIGVRASGDEWGGYFVGDTGAYGYASLASGKGFYGAAVASGGEGVRGYTIGYGGDGVTAIATNSYGFGVDAYTTGYAGNALRAVANGTGAYGGYFRSANYRGIYADGSTGYYDGFFPNTIYVGGYVYGTWGVAVIARNDGAETLEAGDLVAFAGFDGSVLDSGAPALAVTKAGASSDGAIIGVVQGGYVIERSVAVVEPLQPFEKEEPAFAAQAPAKDTSLMPALAAPEEEASSAAIPEEMLMPPTELAPAVETLSAVETLPSVQMPSNTATELATGHFASGPVQPGQYVVVVIQGFVEVKIETDTPVMAGDMVVISPRGVARTVSEQLYTRAPAVGYTVIGRAMESLDEGGGMIYVYVNFR